jgi:LDH2 family malate/lactate/ureidoglycolate dehydrogenase
MFLCDFLSQVEVQVHKEEPIPEGWALGPDGLPTTDASLVSIYFVYLGVFKKILWAVLGSVLYSVIFDSVRNDTTQNLVKQTLL